MTSQKGSNDQMGKTKMKNFIKTQTGPATPLSYEELRRQVQFERKTLNSQQFDPRIERENNHQRVKRHESNYKIFFFWNM